MQGLLIGSVTVVVAKMTVLCEVEL
jgi:hypothetical protein